MKQLLALLSTLFFLLCNHPSLAQNQSLLCASLEALQLPDTVINSASLVPAGEIQTPGTGMHAVTALVPEFCMVKVTVAPAINIEVWLPTSQNWNGKYKAVGGGGLAGNISYGAMVPSIQSHYVTSSTDTGHKVADDLQWLSDPVLMRDYGYRAVHEMALKTKAIIAAYYDRAADYSYFNGCSTGGRQGLIAAQRFPDDFDGIVSGAPVNYFTATHYTQLWISKMIKSEGEFLLSQNELAQVTKTVLAQCDALDGLADGVLEDPRMCSFEPATLLCDASNSEFCLSNAQVAALEAIYQGPLDAETGEALHYSLMVGAERPEGPVDVRSPLIAGDLSSIPREYFARSVFQDENWDWQSYNFASDIELGMQRTGNILEATDPNLDAFQSHGGKLIIYHGWNDPLIYPEGTVAYYDSVIENQAMSSPQQAAATTAEFARLFMVPGMSHCRAGPGTDKFDMQTALETWVEKGQSPARILAEHVEDGEVIHSRPLCAYPAKARYDGGGDVNSSDNFSCSNYQ